MAEFHPRTWPCPLCGDAVAGEVVLPGPSRGPLSSDLRRYPEGPDPIPRLVSTCGSCGFTDEAAGFEGHAPDPDTVVPSPWATAAFDPDSWADAFDPPVDPDPPATLRSLVQAHLRPRISDDPATRWELRAQVVRWTSGGPLREGDAWLRAAWMHDDGGRSEHAVRCRRLALRCYLLGLREPRWFARREDLVVIGYLAGELHRRLGEVDEAQPWFTQAAGWAEGLPRLDDLARLALRQRDDPDDVV